MYVCVSKFNAKTRWHTYFYSQGRTLEHPRSDRALCHLLKIMSEKRGPSAESLVCLPRELIRSRERIIILRFRNMTISGVRTVWRHGDLRPVHRGGQRWQGMYTA